MKGKAAEAELDYEVIIVGAGVAGIYQIKRLLDLGVKATVLEAADGLGGTWYSNRYPGCRFDSESITYGYSFSKEVLDEWHWKERFSSQPENLRYLEFVADKFDLRRHMQFGCCVEAAHFDEDACLWTLRVNDGRELRCRFLIMTLGLLSAATLPRYDGVEKFRGLSFHTYNWPHESLEITGKKVAVIGTGATGIQVIPAIADQVGELTVFQRRPNWAAPLNNSPISEDEMAEIRASYDDIFDRCARTPGGFLHEPHSRGFYDVSREQRVELWNQLYGGSGFGILIANFREIFTDEQANAEFSEYIADRIRQRVDDPAIADKLIPRDHGFGVQRIPLETNYYEAYNRDNVHLVDLSETPIKCVTETGIRTTERDYDFDIIVYATGFDAITGSYDRIDIRGAGGRSLRNAWEESPSTLFGLLSVGFPNMLMPTGPQSASAITNFPRAIETGVDWCTDFLEHAWRHGVTRFEASREAQEGWTAQVKELHEKALMRNAKSWFTGYNSNVDGHGYGKTGYFIYTGGAVKYRSIISASAASGYDGISMNGDPRPGSPLATERAIEPTTKVRN